MLTVRAQSPAMSDETAPIPHEPHPPAGIGDSTMRLLFEVGGAEAAAAARDAVAEGPGGTIGRYRLIERLGEGGFGTVWRAEQSEPIRREVALKVIKAGMDSAEIIARFEAERQALALMEHPNIAGVLDAGTTENGRPFFVMELVRGLSITEYADERKLTIRERLELFIPVCHAVQHAHQKAILHRDLKPSNILVSEVDGRPVPKVIDFGIAKALGGAGDGALGANVQLTQTGTFIGTPRYMSPEQAGAKPDLDTRSDIYTLGVILFELLTGDTPLSVQTLRSAAFDEMLRMIRESEPPRPSNRVTGATELIRTAATTRGTEPAKLTRTLRGDLDWIALRALEKDRERRYGSAAALAADIARHLHSEPVEAGPPSALYRFRKLVRRNRVAFAAAAIILFLLVTGIAVSTWQMIRAMRAEKRADSEAQIARAVTDFLEDDLLQQAGSRKQVESGFKPDPDLTVRQALDRASEKIGDRFKDRPLVEAEVQSTIGKSYHDLGAYESALPHFLRALELRTAALGAEDAKTVGVRHNIGMLLNNMGRFSEAETMNRGTVALYEKILGPTHKDTFSVRNNLAASMYGQHRFAEAEAEWRAMQASEAGQPHFEKKPATYRHNIAEALRKQGKFAEAEAEHRADLEEARRVLGPENPDTLVAWTGVVVSLISQGKGAEAEAECRKLLALQGRVLGPDHPETVDTRTNLGIALETLNRFSEAETEYRRVLSTRELSQGPEDPTVLAMRLRLAGLAGNQGRHADAEVQFRELAAVRERVLGPEHADTLKVRAFLATALKELGRLPEAEKEIRAVLAVMDRKPGANTLAAIENRELLGLILGRQKGLAAEEKEYRLAIADRERLFGKEHAGTLSTRMSLAVCMYRQAKYAEAEAEFRSLLEAYHRLNGPEDRATIMARDNLGNAFGAQGRHAEAEIAHRDAWLAAQRSLGPENSLSLHARLAFADALREQKKFTEAEAEYRSTVAGFDRSGGVERPDMLRALHNLALTLRQLNRHADAVPFARRAHMGRQKTLGDSHQETKDSKKLLDELAAAP